MSLPLSREVGAVLDKAAEIANESSPRVSTAHVLLAMFEVPNPAAKLLSDRAITADLLRREFDGLNREGRHILGRVRERSQRLASGSRSDVVTSLHLLAALVRESKSHAFGMLQACEVDIGAVRTAVMSYATSSRQIPKRFRNPNSVLDGPVPRRTEKMGKTGPTPIGFHPSLGVGRKTSAESHTSLTPNMNGQADGAESKSSTEPKSIEKQDRATGKRKRRNVGGSLPKKRRRGIEKNDRDGAIENLRETGDGLALDNHPGINRGGKPRPRRYRKNGDLQKTGPIEQIDKPELNDAAENPPVHEFDHDEERILRAEAVEEAERTARDLAQRLFSGGADVVAQAEKSKEDKRQVLADPELAEEYTLDEEEFPFLVEYGRNLTVEASMGRIDTVIGRDSEIARCIDILGKRRSNNPLLVGEAGVGKTAIAEGIACRFVELARQNKPIGRRCIVELEMGRLLSGTHLRGAFSERLLGIKDEVARAEGDIIVFLDEIHMWMGAGAGGDGGDAAGELKTALARGKFPSIGATTHDECRKFVESDPAFERRFQRVTVEEPDEETALLIVEGVRTHYERHHGVLYSPGALAASVSMAVRYIHDRQLPDKSIGVMDLAGSRAARHGIETVDRNAIAKVVAEMAAIPAERLTGSDASRFLEMESFLGAGIVGHDEIVITISELLRRNYAGFRSHRPIGSLLFLGPTGVGKTEMVKVLADFLFHDRDAIVRLDMSEFMEAHSVSRFIGAPPGYVGFDQGGQLTEAIRQRPYQVVLLDEVEKAHPDVLNVLLQLFDEGRLTDGRGRKVDFSNALVVMTSNLGSKVFDQASNKPSARIGFSSDDSVTLSSHDDARHREQVLESARDHFTPELWNRIDERLVFSPLNREEIGRIAALQLQESQDRLREESSIEMDYSPELIEYLIENGGFDRKLGARPMRQTIRRLVEGKVAREILGGRVERDGKVYVDVEDGKIVVTAGNCVS